MHDEASLKARALRGVLWGTALGDALGLPFEGLSAAEVQRRGVPSDRFTLWGKRGIVSDDTEQTVLVLESLVRSGGCLDLSVRFFRRALLAWFLRLPFGIGLATLRACLRILFGLRQSGVRSAGNGAAMRAAVIGVFYADDDGRRRAHAGALARVTHLDPRAVDGALFTAELAARCTLMPGVDRAELALGALHVVRDRELYEAIEGAVLMARTRHAPALRNTGYVVSTLALCTWAFVRAGGSTLGAIREVIQAGGDTDTAAAIVGGWLGALNGPEQLPRALLARLDSGPFGAAHLAALADSAVRGQIPAWSRARALTRNLMLYPVVLGHGALRVLQRGLEGPLASEPSTVPGSKRA